MSDRTSDGLQPTAALRAATGTEAGATLSPALPEAPPWHVAVGGALVVVRSLERVAQQPERDVAAQEIDAEAHDAGVRRSVTTREIRERHLEHAPAGGIRLH